MNTPEEKEEYKDYKRKALRNPVVLFWYWYEGVEVWYRNQIYKLCTKALEDDFGNFCDGCEPDCYGCRARVAREFLTDVVNRLC